MSDLLRFLASLIFCLAVAVSVFTIFDRYPTWYRQNKAEKTRIQASVFQRCLEIGERIILSSGAADTASFFDCRRSFPTLAAAIDEALELHHAEQAMQLDDAVRETCAQSLRELHSDLSSQELKERGPQPYLHVAVARCEEGNLN